MGADPLLFGRLLSEAVRIVAAREDKAIAVVQDEIGHALGRSGGTAVEYWRKGHIPADEATIRQLLDELKRRAALSEGAIAQLARRAGLPDTWQSDRAVFIHAPGSDPRPVAGIPRPELGTHPATLDSDPVAGLVGRDTDIELLVRRLAHVRLLTLTGFGGIGKSRLAAAVAQNSTAFFPAGVIWIGLDTVADGADVGQVIQAALRTTGPSGGSVTDSLVVALRDRRALLVLDGCDADVAFIGRLCQDLLDRCPRLAILTTTREALNTADEEVYVVAPLRVPPAHANSAVAVAAFGAVQLFVRRAYAAWPSFALRDDNAGIVAEISRRLDGIPLAIELAASRLGPHSVHEILAGLQDLLGFLKTERRGAPPRHRSLAAAFQWSDRWLSAQERRLLFRLSVFRDGCTLADATTVCADAHLPAATLPEPFGGLVRKSWLLVYTSKEDITRYYCPETVRLYAAQQLAREPERDVLAQRWAAWKAASPPTNQARTSCVLPNSSFCTNGWCISSGVCRLPAADSMAKPDARSIQ